MYLLRVVVITTLAFVFAESSNTWADVVNFEDVAAQSLTNGQTLTSGGIDFTFTLGSFSSANIGNGFDPMFGSGNRLVLSNQTTFSISEDLTSLSLDFADFNNANLVSINGQMVGDKLSTLDGAILAGVDLTLSNVTGGSNPQGTISLNGPITSIEFGTTESVFDNFVFTRAVPEPNSSLLFFMLGASLLRRRRQI